MLWNDQCLIYVTHDTPYDRVMKFLSNGVLHCLFCNISHHTKAVYKCTISRYVKSRKYGPYRGIYTNIAKTAIASLCFQCYNPISYSGHPRGSLRCGGGGGGSARGSYLHGPRPNTFDAPTSPIIAQSSEWMNEWIFISELYTSIYDINTIIYKIKYNTI